MKYEIEIPNLPEGVKPVSVGVERGDLALLDGEVRSSHIVDHSVIKIELLPGYEAIRDRFDGTCTVRRLPRKKVVIDWTPEIQGHIDAGSFWIDSVTAGLFRTSILSSAVRVVEE